MCMHAVNLHTGVYGQNNSHQARGPRTYVCSKEREFKRIPKGRAGLVVWIRAKLEDRVFMSATSANLKKKKQHFRSSIIITGDFLNLAVIDRYPLIADCRIHTIPLDLSSLIERRLAHFTNLITDWNAVIDFCWSTNRAVSKFAWMCVVAKTVGSWDAKLGACAWIIDYENVFKCINLRR
jgi:hypothetical protein